MILLETRLASFEMNSFIFSAWLFGLMCTCLIGRRVDGQCLVQNETCKCDYKYDIFLNTDEYKLICTKNLTDRPSDFPMNEMLLAVNKHTASTLHISFTNKNYPTLPAMLFEKTIKLYSLELSSNQISHIDSNLFKASSGLVCLSMKNNLIKSLSWLNSAELGVSLKSLI